MSRSRHLQKALREDEQGINCIITSLVAAAKNDPVKYNVDEFCRSLCNILRTSGLRINPAIKTHILKQLGFNASALNTALAEYGFALEEYGMVR